MLYVVLTVLGELGISSVETLILSLTTDIKDLNEIKKLWLVLEDCVEKGKLDSLGIADLNVALLTELYSWCKVSKYSCVK